MKNVCLALALAGGLVVPQIVSAQFSNGVPLAATWTPAAGNFTNNPWQNGWKIFGDTNLFQWNSTNASLSVTWDSAQSNSYLYHSLGTILTRHDNFTIAFDMELTEAQAAGYGSELGIGLFNLAEAANAGFNRVTGTQSPDLVEFDYFPDVGYGSTVWPTFVDSASDFNFNGASDYAIYAPILGDWYHIVMMYSAANQSMITTLTNFEQTSGVSIIDAPDAGFTDFRVNAISINSYQDDGEGDTVFAQGAVANIVLTLPPPPVQNLAGTIGNGVWQSQFTSQTNWLYTLQRTTDFVTWTNVSVTTPGNAATLSLTDTNAPALTGYYRVSASRP